MKLTLHLPQLIYMAISCLGLGISASQHGKPKKGNENVWFMVTALVITYSLLIWGGFFN